MGELLLLLLPREEGAEAEELPSYAQMRMRVSSPPVARYVPSELAAAAPMSRPWPPDLSALVGDAVC